MNFKTVAEALEGPRARRVHAGPGRALDDRGAAAGAPGLIAAKGRRGLRPTKPRVQCPACSRDNPPDAVFRSGCGSGLPNQSRLHRMHFPD